MLDLRQRRSARRAITLLEVLLAIGILSIGLLSILSLLPAGRTLVIQAERDDRAAAIIPDAIATMESLGLFTEDSLEWRDVSVLLNDGEASAERPQWHTRQLDRGEPNSPWREEPNDTGRTAKIPVKDSAWYPPEAPRDHTFRGEIPASDVLPVSLTISKNGIATLTEELNERTWTYDMPIAPEPLPSPRAIFRIVESGPTAGAIVEPGTRNVYTCVSSWFDADGNEKTASQSVTIWGRRRAQDQIKGSARINLTVQPDPDANRHNETLDQAQRLSIPGLDDDAFQVRPGVSKIRMVREATARLVGEVWRFRVGLARPDDFQLTRDFAPSDPVTPTAVRYQWPAWFDPRLDPGRLPRPAPYWLQPPDNPDPPDEPEPEDKDFFTLRVRKAYGLEIDWSRTSAAVVDKLNDDVLNHKTRGDGSHVPGLFQIDFRGDRGWERPSDQQPIPGGSWMPYTWENRPVQDERVSYSIPNDGEIRMGVELRGTYSSDHPLAGQPITNTVSYNSSTPTVPRNEQYDITICQYRKDRMIAIDPLMAAHLDRVIGASAGPVGAHPLANRRRYFAEFEQPFVGSPADPRAFVIPRLNWKLVADIADFDAAVAAAERLCRADDSPATSPTRSDDEPPAPDFERLGNDEPLKRRSASRMTWMMTVQPETSGSVRDNWRAGQAFEVSIVIFQDRPFPSDGEFRGEYAFEAGWSDADGMLHVHVPLDQPDGTRLAEDDVKRLFSSGSWLLLGPRVVLSSAPIDDTMAVEWIKIRSSEFEQFSTEGKIVARVLLDREPGPNVLLRPAENETDDPLRLDDDGRLRVMALAYDGVVAVVRRSMTVRDSRPQ